MIYTSVLHANPSNKSTAYLQPTELRLSPNYIKYYNWSRLVALGVVPFIMLVYLNGLMYQDIKSRRQRWSYKENSGESIAATEIVLNTLSTNVVEEPDNSTHKLIKNEHFEITGADSSQKILRVTKTVMIDSGNNTLCDTEPAPKKKAKAAMVMNRMLHNESSRKAEDKMATMFMGIVVVFIACHLPRFILNIHELVTIQAAMKCMEGGQHGFPMWSLVMVIFGHLMLALNSSINIFIYFSLSSRFRQDCKRWYERLKCQRSA